MKASKISLLEKHNLWGECAIPENFTKLTAYKNFSNSFVCVTEKSKVTYLSRKAGIWAESGI